MKLISCHDGKLHALDAPASGDGPPAAAGDKGFRTGLPALDALPPGGAFARGAVHELLSAPADGQPMFFAAWLAQRAWAANDDDDDDDNRPTPGARAVVWSDPARELYPPAVAALGIPLERLFLLHPAGEADQVWAAAECLGCRGVAAAVVALPERRQRLSRVAARRLQLAAERGGGVGLLLRAGGRASHDHAAVTRWLVRPERGERNVQRWRIQLIYGHGGRVGESVILEHHRDTTTTSLDTGKRVRPVQAHPVHPAAELADRPAPAGAAKNGPAATRRTA